MTTYVNIKKGMYRLYPVSGVFPLVKPCTPGKKGIYITVANELEHPFVVREARVKVDSEEDFEYCTATGLPVDESRLLVPDTAEDETPDYEQQLITSESDDEAMDRIHSTFEMLDEITIAAADGIVRGLVVTGPPGVGKSHGVLETLRKFNIQRVLAGLDPRFEVVTGAASPIGLYQKLYNNRDKKQVVLFDDCDGVLFDELSLNLLKAALDSGNKRRLCWNTESTVLRQAEIPDAFDFSASVIFLTNIDFERTRAGKLKDHLRAIMSRCHYLDLEISNQRDQLLRVRQVVRDGMLEEFNFKKGEEIMIVDYFMANADHLREISLRMVKKIADLIKMKPDNWLKYVEATCLDRQAKFKRLLAEKKGEPAAFDASLPVKTEESEEPSTPVNEELLHPAAGPDGLVPEPKAGTLKLSAGALIARQKQRGG